MLRVSGHLALLAVLCLFTACGKRKVDLTVDSLPSRFNGKNPIAYLVNEHEGDTLSVCTAWVAKDGFVVTAGHCITKLYDKSTQQDASKLTLYFKNPSDSKSKAYDVDKVKVFRCSYDSDAADFAVLEPEDKQDIIDNYGFLQLQKAALPDPKVEVETVVYNPGTYSKDVSAWMEIRKGKLSKLREGSGTSLAEMEIFAQGGNSGSPIFYGNNAIGILTHAHSNPFIAQSKGQWMPGIHPNLGVGLMPFTANGEQKNLVQFLPEDFQF